MMGSLMEACRISLKDYMRLSNDYILRSNNLEQHWKEAYAGKIRLGKIYDGKVIMKRKVKGRAVFLSSGVYRAECGAWVGFLLQSGKEEESWSLAGKKLSMENNLLSQQNQHGQGKTLQSGSIIYEWLAWKQENVKNFSFEKL